jgi:uncharacterized protein
MRFWDTSAIIPLLLEQEASGLVRPLLAEDPGIAAWWGTPLECGSAATRLRREGVLTPQEEAEVLSLLDRLRAGWLEILPSQEVRDLGMRLLRVHSLKSADAVQLAAALTWSGPQRAGELVTFDERLSLAARLEGLQVLP